MSIKFEMPFIPDKVYQLCQGKETVTSALAAASPTSTVSSIAEKLYKNERKDASEAKVGSPALSPTDLDRAAQCGKFTSRPSDLFLQVNDLTNHPGRSFLDDRIDICRSFAYSGARSVGKSRVTSIDSVYGGHPTFGYQCVCAP